MASKAGIILAALLALAARPAAADDALELLDAALRPPAVSYHGRMAVTRWYGNRTRSEEIDVRFSPPARYRWEFLSPSESITRTVVSDGRTEIVHSANRSHYGDAMRSSQKLLAADEERALLLRNYEVKSSGQESVAGRKVWVIELSPHKNDRPRQKLWIDAQTHVILENKRFRPNGPSAVSMRFLRFEIVQDHPHGAFSIDSSSGNPKPHGLDPGCLSLVELNRAAGSGPVFPKDIPGGFLFESANFFDNGGRTVKHVRYTDGLSVVSVFQTDRSVKISGTALESLESAGGSLGLSSAGKVLHFKSKHGFLTLISDVSGRLLETIASRFKNPSN